MTPYVEIFKALNQAQVSYLVAGGIAVNLHGVERATADLDLVVHLEEANVRKFAAVMTELGYCPKVPVKAEALADAQQRQMWIDKKNMIVFSFINPNEPLELIDIFVEHPLPFEAMYDKRVVRQAFGTQIPVMSIDDLIVIKMEAGRPKDLFDVSLLQPLQKEQVS